MLNLKGYKTRISMISCLNANAGYDNVVKSNLVVLKKENEKFNISRLVNILTNVGTFRILAFSQAYLTLKYKNAHGLGKALSSSNIHSEEEKLFSLFQNLNEKGIYVNLNMDPEEVFKNL